MVRRFVLATAAAAGFVTVVPEAQECVECHRDVTPGIVQDWELSVHAENEIGCEMCHGYDHESADDVDLVLTVTAKTCKLCHRDKYDEFETSKHALAWSAMKAMPTTHYKPMELIDGMKGCGGCHKIGLKESEEIARLKEVGSGYGFASCDACHTRHTFSVKEAREPEACATCHMGFDHPQWEMYSTSKHGVRHTLKRDGALPESAAAPTCQTCHMPGGNHDVHTSWGFLAVRTDGLAPYPGEDAAWWADRVTILKALGVLDPEGNPTDRLAVVKDAQVARLTAEEFDLHRGRMLEVCSQCHSRNFAEGELGKGDRMIREVDRLLAEAIRIIAGLYADGILENRLFLMHLKHRMRAFQGVFHANPDYALWYGWNEMQLDLNEIKSEAAALRAEHAGSK